MFLFFIHIHDGYSQSTQVETKLYGMQAGNMGVWGYMEHGLYETIALRTEVGFDTGSPGSNLQYLSGFTVTPVLTIEPRWYYNLSKRSLKSKQISNNTGSFLALSISYNPDILIVDKQEQGTRFATSDISAIPTWGIRRQWGSKFHYEAGLGLV